MHDLSRHRQRHPHRTRRAAAVCRRASIDVSVEAATVDEPPGSPAAILRALQQPPHLTREDVDELERAIEGGKLPPTTRGIFDEAD